MKTVLKSFDEQHKVEWVQALETLQDWRPLLGDGDPAVLAFGQKLLSPRSFRESFEPAASHHKENLLFQEERHLTTGDIFENAENLNNILTSFQYANPEMEEFVEDTKLMIML